jgi:hypothetical protein
VYLAVADADHSDQQDVVVDFMVMWTQRVFAAKPVAGVGLVACASSREGRAVVASVSVVDAAGAPVAEADRFLAFVLASGGSPNTALAYGYDLRYLFEFLDDRSLDWKEFSPAVALELLGCQIASGTVRRGTGSTSRYGSLTWLASSSSATRRRPPGPPDVGSGSVDPDPRRPRPDRDHHR